MVNEKFIRNSFKICLSFSCKKKRKSFLQKLFIKKNTFSSLKYSQKEENTISWKFKMYKNTKKYKNIIECNTEIRHITQSE